MTVARGRLKPEVLRPFDSLIAVAYQCSIYTLLVLHAPFESYILFIR
jgi:hypothetical protein